MHRQAATSGQGRRLKVRSGANIVRFLWLLGYLSVGLGALFSTFFYPDLLFMLRPQRDTVQPELHVVAQVFLRVPTVTCDYLAQISASLQRRSLMLNSPSVLPLP
jgi:hypothetical protein